MMNTRIWIFFPLMLLLSHLNDASSLARKGTKGKRLLKAPKETKLKAPKSKSYSKDTNKTGLKLSKKTKAPSSKKGSKLSTKGPKSGKVGTKKSSKSSKSTKLSTKGSKSGVPSEGSKSAAPTVTASSAPTVTTSSAPTVTASSAPTVTASSAPTVAASSAPTVTSSSAPTVTASSAPTVTASSAPTITAVFVSIDDAGGPVNFDDIPEDDPFGNYRGLIWTNWFASSTNPTAPSLPRAAIPSNTVASFEIGAGEIFSLVSVEAAGSNSANPITIRGFDIGGNLIATKVINPLASSYTTFNLSAFTNVQRVTFEFQAPNSSGFDNFVFL
eukprot:scaffold3650_cov76-Cylindrotheca_fusiformis.AAC.1